MVKKLLIIWFRIVGSIIALNPFLLNESGIQLHVYWSLEEQD